MKILFLGDISGRPGRETVERVLPSIKQKYSPDFVIANAENAAGGRGVTAKVLNELMSYGIDFFTAGEHYWDQPSFLDVAGEFENTIIRPYNYEATEQLPGKGYSVIDKGSAGQLLVISLIGQTFMRDNVQNPFWAADELFEKLQGRGVLNEDLKVLVDFHAEATSDKLSLAWYLEDKVDAFVGTHTHVATADNRILGDKLAYVTDVGMVGPYEASLWVSFESVIQNYKYPFKTSFKMEEEGPRIFNSVLIDLDGNSPSITRVDRTT